MEKDNMVQPSITRDRFLRVTEVVFVTGLSKATLYRLMAQGKFPKQIKISSGAVGWRESEVMDWLDRKTAESRDGPIAIAS